MRAFTAALLLNGAGAAATALGFWLSPTGVDPLLGPGDPLPVSGFVFSVVAFVVAFAWSGPATWLRDPSAARDRLPVPALLATAGGVFALTGLYWGGGLALVGGLLYLVARPSRRTLGPHR